jgi:hypothetical protein
LRRDPFFGVIERFEHTTAVQRVAADHAAIDQEQEDSRAAGQGGSRPVRGAGKVILKMEAGIAKRLLDQSIEVLVVAVPAIVGKQLNPLPGQVANG